MTVQNCTHYSRKEFDYIENEQTGEIIEENFEKYKDCGKILYE
jgi:hypothetical protein